MTISARAVTARLVPFDTSRNAGTYGTGVYGTGTYGSLETDPLSNVYYELVPYPATRGVRPAWEFRQGDTYTRFEAVAAGYNDNLDLDLVSAAALVLDAQTPGVEWHSEFMLNVDRALDRFWYEFDVGELPIVGRMRVAVKLLTVGGRYMTLEPSDAAVLVVSSSPGSLV